MNETALPRSITDPAAQGAPAPEAAQVVQQPQEVFAGPPQQLGPSGQPQMGSEVGDQATVMPLMVGGPRGPMTVGGIMEVKSAEQVMEEARAAALAENSQPVITGLAGYIRRCWQEARTAKEQSVEPEMIESLRQRNGEYNPSLLTQLKQQGSTTVYMMLTSNKCRGAAAWLREALGGMPWSCKPTPVSDIDDQTKAAITNHAQQAIEQSLMMGIFPSDDDVKQFMLAVRDQAFARIQETANERAERMTLKMKDQLFEGGFEDAMDSFIDDLVTFPAAILKGPVVRIRPQLNWVIAPDSTTHVAVEDAYKLEWERVDPLMLYPAPDATTVDDGYLIERHRLSRKDLVDLREVEGYSADAINAVLEEYGKGGLYNWLTVDVDRAPLEGKAHQALDNPSGLIDAIQFWGSVQGRYLVDWGLSEDEVEDLNAEYQIEAWLVDRWVIKAMVNPDPLGRRPYYKTSWENIPGRFWGRSIPDLCRDTQAVCNAAARALVNNMSLASGPQVAIDVGRIPAGSDLTEMVPWKIWQFEDNGGVSAGAPVSFFQPQSIAGELMQIYEKFSVLTDEYTSIPRYMTGDARVGGAGSTASGMNMLMTNAGKAIKNVVASVDRVMKQAIERLYFYNMQYLDDPELKGDVNIIAEGAEALMLKQAQQQRQAEVLNIVASNPLFVQLIGQEGIAYMLREVLKPMGFETDKIIPATPILKAKIAAEQLQQMAAMQQQMAMQQQAQGQPQAGGSKAKPDKAQDQRRLMDGSPQSVANAAPQLPR